MKRNRKKKKGGKKKGKEGRNFVNSPTVNKGSID